MKLLTLTLVLSLLAFVSLSQAKLDDIDWKEAEKCAKVGAQLGTSLIKEYVPGLQLYLDCIDFNPSPNQTQSIYGYARSIFELLKRSVEGNIQCLVNPLKKGISLLKPAVDKLNEYKCFPKSG